jgi:hypothetical protein
MVGCSGNCLVGCFWFLSAWLVVLVSVWLVALFVVWSVVQVAVWSVVLVVLLVPVVLVTLVILVFMVVLIALFVLVNLLFWLYSGCFVLCLVGLLDLISLVLLASHLSLPFSNIGTAFCLMEPGRNGQSTRATKVR